jgi:hypothetical protein
MAKQLGNKHRYVMALLDKYLDTFKTHALCEFLKNADGERRQGVAVARQNACAAERNQAYFLLSLS